MGIVIKQSIQNTLITFVGFTIGGVNTLFLYTNFLQKEYYGLVSYLVSVSNLLWPLIAFGSYNAIIKFYSSYQNSEDRNKFMTFMLLLPLGIAVLLGGIAFLFYESILNYFEGENDIVQPYVWTIFIIAIAQAYFELFFSWVRVKLKSVFGTALKELFIRIGTSILLILVALHIITVVQFIYLLIALFVVRMLLMLWYAFLLHKIQFHFSAPSEYKNILKYSTLIVVAGSVAALILDLDKTMIERYLPIENVAQYAICAYIASVVIIPSRAMHQITYPLTASHINQKKWKDLEILLKKSSINLLIPSGLLLILIISNVQELFRFIPDTYRLHIWIVVCIGFAKLYDNILGTTNAILYNSDYYRIILFYGIAMAALAFLFNLLFIPVIHLDGAAIATLLAIFLYNSAKVWTVYRKFKIHPFSNKTFWLLGVIGLLAISGYFTVLLFHPLFSIILKSMLITFLFIGFLFYSSVSEEATGVIKKYILKFLGNKS